MGVTEKEVDTTRSRRAYRVSELLSGLNALLEDRVGRLWVVGEIANFHRAASGHAYFSLKDAGGQLRSALFRSAASRVPFEVRNGLEVMAYGDVSVYQARGELQLVVHKLEPRGLGALQLAFEELRERLAAEGLFDPERKQSPPPFPAALGVVTSPTSAAIQDVIEVSGRRSPATPLLISPTRVQGEGAEFEIAAAIDALSSRPEIDSILLVRGGGSLEDLFSFNTEVVARAIARCPLPVISGVGHETDFTIADFVADVRAPTPSAAVEQVLPDRRALLSGLGRDWRRRVAAIQGELRRFSERISREREVLRMLAPSARLAAQARRLAASERALLRAIARRRERWRTAVEALGARLDTLSPLAVLGRGYALVTRERDSAIVRAADELQAGEGIRLRLARGEVGARVEAIEPAEE
jgi:exodeoxyribonuclease VII large subunit